MSFTERFHLTSDEAAKGVSPVAKVMRDAEELLRPPGKRDYNPSFSSVVPGMVLSPLEAKWESEIDLTRDELASTGQRDTAVQKPEPIK